MGHFLYVVLFVMKVFVKLNAKAFTEFKFWEEIIYVIKGCITFYSAINHYLETSD